MTYQLINKNSVAKPAPAYPGIRGLRNTLKGTYKRALVSLLFGLLRDQGRDWVEAANASYAIGVVLSDPTVSEYVYLADTDIFTYSPQERMEFILVRAAAIAGRRDWISFEIEEEICEIIASNELQWISHHGVKMHHENLRAPTGDTFSYYTEAPKSTPVLF